MSVVQNFEIKTDHTVSDEKVILSQIAQSALESLVKGEEVNEQDHARLVEKRRQFTLAYGDKISSFYLDQVVLYRGIDQGIDGPKDRVLIHSCMGNEDEYTWLNVNPYGEANFKITLPDDRDDNIIQD